MNDVAALNIDSALVRNTRALNDVDQVVELQNGCVCCTLRTDFVKALADLAGTGRFDVIVVEASGVSEPAQMAEMFRVDVSEETLTADADARDKKAVAGVVKALNGASTLQQVARLDTCVTVVDAHAFDGDLVTPQISSSVSATNPVRAARRRRWKTASVSCRSSWLTRSSSPTSSS